MNVRALEMHAGRSSGAYSLVEMLVVTAVIALLLAMISMFAVTPAGMMMNKATVQVAGILEDARAYAMSTRSYTWVGISQQDLQMDVAAIHGTQGTSNDIASTDTYRRLGKNFSFDLMKATNGIPGFPDDPLAQFAGSSTMPSFKLRIRGQGSDTTFSQVIQFSPSGEARINDSAAKWIQIGLLSYKGEVADTNNGAIVRVGRFGGGVEILRR